MIVDTSAFAAILFDEPEAPVFANILSNTDVVLVSSVTLMEGRIVLYTRHGAQGINDLDKLLLKSRACVVDFTSAHAELALQAFSRFGKGRHPASLNLCDCAVYALAKEKNQPLLFKGNDFTQTDVISVRY